MASRCGEIKNRERLIGREERRRGSHAETEILKRQMRSGSFGNIGLTGD